VIPSGTTQRWVHPSPQKQFEGNMIISATIILGKLFTNDQMVTFTKNNNEQGAMTNHWFHQLLTKGVKNNNNEPQIFGQMILQSLHLEFPKAMRRLNHIDVG